MKKLTLILIIFSIIALKSADVLSDLAITKAQAEDFVIDNFTNSSLSLPNKARKIPLNARASIVQAMGTFTKTFVKTDAFKSRYAEWWKNAEPTKPETPEVKIAAQKQQEADAIIEQAKSLETLKKQVADTKDPAMKKQLQEMYDMTVKMYAEMKVQMEDPEYKKSMKEAQDMMQKMESEQYQTDFTAYQEKYKQWQAEKNPNILIKNNLMKFLTETENIDFNAKLITNQNGRTDFENEEYKEKSSEWKQAFRAGKPTIETARNIAKEWLVELK